MIEIRNLSKSYGNKLAVNNLNFTIKDGEILGLVGANGAGKSTLIKMMTGIVKPDEGCIFLNGFEITDKRQSLKAKRQFGYIPDSPDNFLRLTGIQYLNFMCDIYGVGLEHRADRIKELSKELNIYESLDQRIITYSHGMRQKVNIVAVLLYEPKIWILDEPMVGLDPEAAFFLKKKMKEHAEKGNIVFFSTHVIEMAESLCDRIIVMKNGNPVFEGTPLELKSLKDDMNIEEILIEIIKEGEDIERTSNDN